MKIPTLQEIRRLPIINRLIYILVPSIAIVDFYWTFLVERFINLIYTNFVIYNPTTYSVAPESYHAFNDPASAVVIFFICVLFFFVLYGNTTIEEL